MYRRKMEKQTRRQQTPMLPELSDDNKRSQPLPQVQAYNRLTPDKSMPTPDRSIPMPALVAPASPQQRCQDDPPRANRMRARDLLRDFERDGLEVYNSPQTNLELLLLL
jgi:hypothetical protein